MPDHLRIVVAHADAETRRNAIEAVDGRHTVIAECTKAAEIHEVTKRLETDLMITGVRFPDGDGIEVVVSLSETRGTPVPSVVLADTMSVDLVERAMEDHVMSYLVEPVKAETLRAAIRVAKSRFDLLQELADEVDDLREALRARKIIERAKGVIMASDGVSEMDAYATLRSRAQSQRCRIIEVAGEVLDGHAASDGGRSASS